MRDAEAANAPLGDCEVDGLFAPFADAGLIALAISGGADSLALMAAAARWRERRGGRPDLLVLTVDHRLRRGSGREAARVAAVARERGLAARVLVRKGPPPAADIEAAARRERYRLLLAAARSAAASHLLTAHHRDDLAETLLLRLQRGAGVFGLAAMRPAIDLGGIVLARPLLDVPRARLAATAHEVGLVPVADPMNADPRFARSRVRALLPLLAREGLGAEALAATARRLAGAAEAIDAAAGELLAAAVETNDFAVARLEPQRFQPAPAEVRQRALARLLMAVGGDDYPPRFDRLDGLARAIAAHAAGRFKRTLGGVVVEWRDGRFALYREIGRQPPAAVLARPGKSVIWDRRFAVTLGHGVPGGLIVAALGEAGRRAIGAAAGPAPAGAVAALPALWRRAQVVAVPSLRYLAPAARGFEAAVRPLLADRLAAPPLFPDLAG